MNLHLHYVKRYLISDGWLKIQENRSWRLLHMYITDSSDSFNNFVMTNIQIHGCCYLHWHYIRIDKLGFLKSLWIGSYRKFVKPPDEFVNSVVRIYVRIHRGLCPIVYEVVGANAPFPRCFHTSPLVLKHYTLLTTYVNFRILKIYQNLLKKDIDRIIHGQFNLYCSVPNPYKYIKFLFNTI